MYQDYITVQYLDRSISKRRRHETHEQRDRISNLPTDLMYIIMERLPLKDAAAMSLLSHKWQHIWTSIPHLVFDLLFFSSLNNNNNNNELTCCDIVNKILLQHIGPIPKFSIELPPLDSISDIISWTYFLSRNGLREFSFSNLSNHNNISLSSRLFSCGLKKLSLSSCYFSLPCDLKGFAKLSSLELHRVSLTHSVFYGLTANCSVLKTLVLTKCTGMEHRHIVIDAPSLKILVLDWAFMSFELKSCPNLVEASIDMKLAKYRHKVSLYKLLHVVATFTPLKRLCLSGWFCKVLFKEGSFDSTFGRLTNLEFMSLQLDNSDEFSSLLSCMQSFYSIEILRIYVRTKFDEDEDEDMLDLRRDCTLQHLRCATVDISGSASEELKLVEFLLGCSPVLEKLTVLTTRQAQLSQSCHSKMLSKLNQFRRASQKVQVICPEPTILARRHELQLPIVAPPWMMKISTPQMFPFSLMILIVDLLLSTSIPSIFVIGLEQIKLNDVNGL